MGRYLALFAGVTIALLALALVFSGQDLARPGSCSTFVLDHGKTLLVGHNLDEGFEVPGLVVVNPRGLAKSNFSYDDLKSSARQSRRAPRLTWVSRYGSVTYNVFGREFPDGGINEPGLYVGEMTLLGTEWPDRKDIPRMYHHQWIQYLLDNFANVEGALQSLAQALPEGHCQWHFFLADKAGGAAVVEFLEGRPIVHTGEALPYKILCNDPYEAELADLPNYEGFGGPKKAELHHEREDPRFRWAAVMLRDYEPPSLPEEYAFAVLKRIDLGHTKWSVVCDLAKGRVLFRTSRAQKLRWVDLESFDFRCTAAPLALDIHQDLEGDVAGHCAALAETRNKEMIAAAWAEIDLGALGNTFFKPRMIKGLGNAAAAMTCAAE
jgi:penicillin V acylase-like amidase (Ntn superfamily)